MYYEFFSYLIVHLRYISLLVHKKATLISNCGHKSYFLPLQCTLKKSPSPFQLCLNFF